MGFDTYLRIKAMVHLDDIGLFGPIDAYIREGREGRKERKEPDEPWPVIKQKYLGIVSDQSFLKKVFKSCRGLDI